jgi:sigma54-dependent transcription regulator
MRIDGLGVAHSSKPFVLLLCRNERCQSALFLRRSAALHKSGHSASDTEREILWRRTRTRVRRRHTFRRLGATREIAVDVRVLAMTNRSLREEVARGRFREYL